MTTLTEARQSLQTRFIEEWGETSPFLLDNEKFDSIPHGTWVRFNVRNYSGKQRTLGPKGSRRYDRMGAIIAQVFTPEGEGASNADILASQLQNIFEGETVDSVYCNNSSIRESGQDGKYNQTIVEIDLYYDETK